MAVRYETSVTLEKFAGIDESAGRHNLGLSVAAQAENCDTSMGYLRPAPGFQAVYPPLPGNAAIVTLCTFYRRWCAVENQRRVLVAASATALYAILEGASAWTTLITGLTGGGRWSWVTYDEDDGSGGRNDILILTNATDGMYVVHGDDLSCTAQAVTLIGAGGNTAIKFDIIERHAERIWGCGVEGEPDNLYYSRPMMPFDFNLVFSASDGSGATTDPTQGTDILPESSGGVIQLPTWDGDKFVALKRFSNYLLAFKENSAFYIKGLTPGEFASFEAYGADGAMAPGTVVTDGPAAYYLADKGLGLYDGDTAQLLDNDRLGSVFGALGSLYKTSACATILRHTLYLAVPKYERTVRVVSGLLSTPGAAPEEPAENNVLVVYDTRRQTYMLRTGISATSLHSHGGRILFTTGSNPAQVYEVTGTTYGANPVPVKWASAWQDLGAKNVVKSGFVLYLTGLECATRQRITVGIETEKKRKTRTLTITPGMSKARFPINVSGRRWRLVIEADSTENWVLAGGVQIDMELDAD